MSDYRVEKKVPCPCASSDTPGYVEDEGWSHYGHGFYQYDRTPGDGLLECGLCEGDLWIWEQVSTPSPVDGRMRTMEQPTNEAQNTYQHAIQDLVQAAVDVINTAQVDEKNPLVSTVTFSVMEKLKEATNRFLPNEIERALIDRFFAGDSEALMDLFEMNTGVRPTITDNLAPEPALDPESYCLSVDMSNSPLRNHHLLCEMPKGHGGDVHTSGQFSWPAKVAPAPPEVAERTHDDWLEAEADRRADLPIAGAAESRPDSDPPEAPPGTEPLWNPDGYWEFIPKPRYDTTMPEIPEGVDPNAMMAPWDD